MDTDTDTDTGADIAIIGMSGRFPGAASVDALWQRLCEGWEARVAFGDDELRARGVPEASLRDTAYVKAGMALMGIGEFDAAFFGYNPREADRLDPQQRLFLEVSWEALEHAGRHGPRGVAGEPAGLTGVYAGTGANTYLLTNLLPHEDLRGARDISSLLGLMNGNDKDSLSTCVSYKLDLRGPAVTVQTACSTSLVAVHMACRSLLTHEVDMALAGGVWLNLMQDGGYLHQPGSILSPDGHCRAFDARAEGTVIGSGAGVVVLKRLADALADGDTIHAVIKGTAVNNDGSSKVGYTAPSIEGQADVILAAQAVAGVSADSIGYVEAHGTGTTLGDPVEVAALTQAFRASSSRRGYCALGSVKTNLGHLDAAAGVTGLIKVALMLKHAQLPPSLHFERPNPRIDFESSPFYVNTALTAWPPGDGPRRAAVSSFGMGGTNAHAVLEEPPRPAVTPASACDGRLLWLPLSARSESALEIVRQNLRDHLRADPEPSLADVAHTLQRGRRSFAHRAAVVCRSVDEALAALDATGPGWCAGERAVPQEAPPVAFLFPGQGAQHVGMAAELYRNEPVFRAEVDRCLATLTPHLGLNLGEVLYPDLFPATGSATAAEGDPAERLSRTALTQPALFVVEHAMAQWWMSRGVQPEAMLGHSIGEYVAACLAGVWTLDEALRLVAARGRLLQALPPGAMLAVGLSEGELAPYLRDGCDLAAVNGPEACVLSGPHEVIDAVARDLAGREVAVKRLPVSHAFHSAMLAPALGPFRAVLGGIALRPPQRPFVSNVTGTWITPEQATDAEYWVAHLRGTVRFADGLRTLLARPDRVLLEVGPGETLGTLARRQPQAGAERLVLFSEARPGQSAAPPLATWAISLARLWTAGVAVDWPQGPAGEIRRRVPLPSYPFERQRHWVEAPAPSAAGAGTATRFAGPPSGGVDGWFYRPVWRRADALPTPRVGTSGHDPSPIGAWLVLGQAEGLGADLVAELRARGQVAVLAEAGDEAAQRGPHHHVIRPMEASDLQRLLQDLADAGHDGVQVVHTWSLADRPRGLARRMPHQDPLVQGFFSLEALRRALVAQGASRSSRIAPRVIVVADGLFDVTGQEHLEPVQATLLGPCLSMPHDLEGLACVALDLQPTEPGSPARAAQIHQLLAEARRIGPRDEWAVAYRGEHRWLRSFVPLERAASPEPALRPQGVYLITGGLGGIGLSLARHLAHTAKARLVLLGRSASLPPREQWLRLLDDAATSPAMRERLRAVMDLEALGAEVMLAQVDVSDAVALRDAVAIARHRFGALHGVVHAAGEAGEAPSGAADRSDAEHREAQARVLAAKVQGGLALMSALRDTANGEPLDFVMLCSSLSSVAGAPGQAAYSAANACLDALAAQAWREGHGHGVVGPVTAVNWDGWREVGMAAGMTLPPGVGIAPAQGVEVFERLLAGPLLPQVLVSTLALDTRLSQTTEQLLAQALAWSQGGDEGKPAAGASAPLHRARPALLTPFASPEEGVQQTLAELWQRLLGLQPVGADDHLLELGGDSLLAIQMLAQVRQHFGVAVSPADFLQTPTIAALAVLVETRLIEEIEQS
ncbi:MAG: SDR family NAD(P)-dependent oxidoreductase [Rubrivivax sp.]|nr:MAG: SDR family NAD(P)-dependent oxidoreductase [Rubrivivax sp.]